MCIDAHTEMLSVKIFNKPKGNILEHQSILYQTKCLRFIFFKVKRRVELIQLEQIVSAKMRLPI